MVNLHMIHQDIYMEYLINKYLYLFIIFHMSLNLKHIHYSNI